MCFCALQLESSPTDGLRILHINNVTLAHSGEVQLYLTHPGKPYSSLKSYTTLAVIPRPPKSNDSDSSSDEVKPQEVKYPKAIETSPPIVAEGDLSSSKQQHKDRLHQPACILEGPTDCTALIGGCVRLSVIYEGLPKPQVVWFKAVSVLSTIL